MGLGENRYIVESSAAIVFFLKQSLFSIVYEAITSLLSENILQLYVMNIKTFFSLWLTERYLSYVHVIYGSLDNKVWTKYHHMYVAGVEFTV